MMCSSVEFSIIIFFFCSAYTEVTAPSVFFKGKEKCTLGPFKYEWEAAQAYDDEALRYYGVGASIWLANFH